MAFAIAPKDLQLSWWQQPTTHPAYSFPCLGSWCDPDGFTIGDVLFVEVVVAYALCSLPPPRLEPTTGAALVHELRVRCSSPAVGRNRRHLFEIDAEQVGMGPHGTPPDAPWDPTRAPG